MIGKVVGIGAIAYYGYATGRLFPKNNDQKSDPTTGTNQKKQYKINYITPWGSAEDPDYSYTEISVEKISEFSVGELITTTNPRFPGPMFINHIWDSGQGHGSLQIVLAFTGTKIEKDAGFAMKMS